MGWNIFHGTDRNNEICRSYTTISNLAQAVADVLPARDWRTLAPVLNHRYGDAYFSVPAADAGRIASLLHKAASHRRMPPDFGDLARELANAAQAAANARQPWEWR
ncbi:hypothetical protein [Streptomyces natalensis]|uniref:DUF7739 domain-containing protein n=1 Tax=Streptomyces natalensis ATCC 27448 TaxID=1240678 RepID=A0A0D7CN58_9ACTN|nr:hypothetical protein [Streptomyces natalensis]KIZ16852.1 hypothetical protein SNA_17825 [Streptomyces natalensis ATCC 27448]